YTAPQRTGGGSIAISLYHAPPLPPAARELNLRPFTGVWQRSVMMLAPKDPDALVALNAGILSYSTWHEVVCCATMANIPFACTDYAQQSAQMYADNIPAWLHHAARGFSPWERMHQELVRQRARPVTVNPFHRPGQRPISQRSAGTQWKGDAFAVPEALGVHTQRTSTPVQCGGARDAYISKTAGHWSYEAATSKMQSRGKLTELGGIADCGFVHLWPTHILYLGPPTLVPQDTLQGSKLFKWCNLTVQSYSLKARLFNAFLPEDLALSSTPPAGPLPHPAPLSMPYHHTAPSPPRSSRAQERLRCGTRPRNRRRSTSTYRRRHRRRCRAGRHSAARAVQLMGAVVQSSEPTQAVVHEKNVRPVARISPRTALGQSHLPPTEPKLAYAARWVGYALAIIVAMAGLWRHNIGPHDVSTAAATAPPPSNGDSDEQGVGKAGSLLDEDAVRAAGEEAADGNVDETLSFGGRECRVCYVARHGKETAM
ncbi:hypothetical protein GGX14DRAFT_674326, partial [Mycena pura]